MKFSGNASSRIVLTFCLLLTSPAYGAADSTAQVTEKNSYYFLPFGGYTPETRILVGASMLALLRTLRESRRVPISTVSLSLTLTQNKQYTLALSPDIFTADGSLEIRPHVSAELYPNSFAGIGTHLASASKESYTSRSYSANAYVLKKFYSEWRIGPFLEFQSHTNIKTTPGGQLDRRAVPGAAGTTFFGAGVNLEWDDLDNRQFPMAGSHVGLSFIEFPGFLGTTDPYGRLVLDVKHFVQVFPGHVVGAQYFFRSVMGSPPFQALSAPGLLRGVDGTRALDNNLAAIQAEYRFPIFYKVRGDVFGGLAQVSPNLNLLPLAKVIPAGGAGLRWVLDDESKINLRLDFAWSTLGNGFYASIGEGF